MHKLNKSSSGSRLQPYMRKGFVFETKKESDVKILGPIMTDEEFREFTKNRTKRRSFYIPPELCFSWGNTIFEKGSRLLVKKEVMTQIMSNHWDKDHLKRWENLNMEKIILVNIGLDWWVALG